jgi:hypothetical protein
MMMMILLQYFDRMNDDTIGDGLLLMDDDRNIFGYRSTTMGDDGSKKRRIET